SASLSINLDSLFFVSERPGGIGGKDIYLAIRDVNSNSWKSIENLGQVINTEYDEESVFLSADGKTLYFSSQGHNSMGGFDIFKSDLKEKKWSAPVNLGYPLNTADDDVNFLMTPDGRKGYYASVKAEGFGERDLYLVEFGEYSEMDADSALALIESYAGFIAGKKTVSSVVLKGLVTNSYNRKPLAADIQIFYSDSAIMAEQVKTDPKTGKFAVFLQGGKSYILNVTAPNHNSATATVTIPTANQSLSISKDFELSVLSGVTTLLNGNVLDKTSKQPIIADILIKDGINENDIAKIKSNQNGDFQAALPAGRIYSIIVKAPDYMTEYDDLEIPLDKKGQASTKNIEMNSLAQGSRILLKNIFYDFNKASLRPRSIIELDRVIELLNEYPSMRIEISSHTDNKGSEEYNKNLSQDRSTSVLKYLVGKGINSARLENKGYGFSQPIATNDTDDGRQMNRRTEIRILSK
ncbi:MAG: hypothetical protein RLZZ46_1496, partial [Bacteroidota bacterium]